MQDWLRANRHRIEQDLADSRQRRYFSASMLAQYENVLPLIRRYAGGKVIDLGCGTMPYEGVLSEKASAYHTLDISPRSRETTYVADIQDMRVIESASYDSAICLEVLEHVPSPQRAVGEVERILKSGGIAIVSVPHLSRLHDEPNDYFRFTGHGLRFLLETSGLEVLELRAKGGLLSFLAHQVSTLLLAAVWPVPGLRQMAWFLNKWLITWPCFALDRLVSGAGVFALGYVGVARKPGMERDSNSKGRDV